MLRIRLQLQGACECYLLYWHFAPCIAFIQVLKHSLSLPWSENGSCCCLFFIGSYCLMGYAFHLKTGLAHFLCLPWGAIFYTIQPLLN